MRTNADTLAWRRRSFREVNDLIHDSASRHEIEGRLTGFLCECGSEACLEPIRLSLSEFRGVRGESNRWAVAVGHEPVAARIIARNERFCVLDDTAAEMLPPPPSQLFAAPPAA